MKAVGIAGFELEKSLRNPADVRLLCRYYIYKDDLAPSQTSHFLQWGSSKQLYSIIHESRIITHLYLIFTQCIIHLNNFCIIKTLYMYILHIIMIAVHSYM